MTSTEQYRHECEVRTLIRARRQYGRQWLREWLEDAKVAGRKEALMRDIREQMERGNDGGHGKWL